MYQRVDQSEQLKVLGVIANNVAVDLQKKDSPEALRALGVLTDVVSLTKNEEPTRNEVNLKSVVSDFFQGDEYQDVLLNHPKIDFVSDIQNSNAHLLVSRPHLDTLLLSLTRYVVQAQPEDQVVILSARKTRVEAQILFQHEVALDEYYILKVADEGQGIDPLDLVNIFDPVEITKSFAGLNKHLRNLAAVWTILRNHGGAIEIYSVPGSTRLDLYFPLGPANVS